MANVFSLTATVSSFLAAARTLLQDTVQPYRYPDADLVAALNLGLTAARRLRPDLFIGVTPFPRFDGNDNDTDMVPIDDMYRLSLVYFIVGHAQLRDEEDTQD